MKKITNYASYLINGKEVLMISNNYRGSPIMFYQHDILICSKELIKKYRNQIFPKQPHSNNKKTIVRYI